MFMSAPCRLALCRALRAFAGASTLLFAGACVAHASDVPVVAQVRALLGSLPSQVRARTVFAFDDAERYRFGWTPGRREGVRLDELDGR